MADSLERSSDQRFSYISGFDNKDEGKKKMDGVQRCPTDGQQRHGAGL